jgi:putative ABC transport system permease protein
MTGTGFALTFARRDLRGGWRGFVVFLACLALGVMAITAVGVLNAAVERGIARDARALLGGDAAFEASGLPIAPEETAGLLPAGSRTAEVVQTNAIVTAPDGRTLAVSLKAVDDAWPLIGAALTEPADALAAARTSGGALVERTLLARLGIAIGDRLRLGAVEVPVSGVLVAEPDRAQALYGIGPRVLVPRPVLDAAGILRPGAVAGFSLLVELPPGTDLARWAAAAKAAYPEARWRLRGFTEVQPQIARFTERLASYLTLAALTALVTGGVGIALAVRGHLEGKRATIAILKSLGASRAVILRVYLGQVVLMGLLASTLGAVVGHLLLLAVRLVPPEVLPVDVPIGIHPAPVLLAILIGVATAVGFGLLPLLRARDLPPAWLFRSLVEADRRPRWTLLLPPALALGATAGLAILAVPRTGIGAVFVAGAVTAALLLAGLARLGLKLAHRAAERGPALVRLALRQIDRPGSTAGAAVVAVGTATAVLALVLSIRASLDRELQQALPERAPGVVFIDIQPDQAQAFAELVQSVPGARIMQDRPVLRARVVRIGGELASEAKIAENVRWTLSRDRGLSWTGPMPEGTELTAGSWWPDDYRGPPLVSVEDEVALGYGLGVGDTIGFNVLGRVIEARIANLRKDIDWGRARLDFVFVLSPGVIDQAPHTRIAAVAVPPEHEAALLDAAARALPNVTPISISEVGKQIGAVIEKIAAAINVIAAVTVTSGLLVLAGALAAARRRTHQQSVIMKILGATRGRLLQLYAIEHLAVGGVAALIGLLVGWLGGWMVTTQVMRLGFSPPWAGGLILALAAVAVTAAAGAWSAARVLRQPAAPVLRGV